MLSGVLDRIWGRGEHAITIPPMDGALRPNTGLDDAGAVLAAPGVDDAARLDGAPVFSCGAALLGADGARLAEFDAPILALAGLQDGGIAAALEGGRIMLKGGARDGRALDLPEPLHGVTALCALEDDALCVAVGSSRNGPDHWRRDLLEKGRAGSVWRLSLDDGAAPAPLARDLGWAGGVAVLGDRLLISESWRARIVSVPLSGGAPQRFIDHLPAYPGRLTPDGAGGVWVSFFAPRRQLVEFVLREDRYRRAMLREVEEEHWIAPCLRSGRSFLEPLQQGGVKQLGVLKPWAPSFSYGLAARIDGRGRAQSSLHSRADGARHGVTACLAEQGALLVVAKGDGVVCRAETGERS